MLSPQARPLPVQARPAQQGCPGPPHCAHTPALQVRPSLPQLLPAQQGCPGPPQAAHWPPAQATLGAVHWAGPPATAQQGWPGPPQVPQLPAPHMPPMTGQVEPAPVHRLLTQQPPAPQVLAPQQASPGRPQWVHTPSPLPVQMSLASQARPAQQAWPGPPQA